MPSTEPPPGLPEAGFAELRHLGYAFPRWPRQSHPLASRIPAAVQYSESQFRTLKYRPEFPDRFGSIQDARAFCLRFFPWYNDEHRHSALGLMTPAIVHYDQALLIRQQRQAVLDAAYRAHPERFVRKAPRAPELQQEVWINKPPDSKETSH